MPGQEEATSSERSSPLPKVRHLGSEGARLRPEFSRSQSSTVLRHSGAEGHAGGRSLPSHSSQHSEEAVEKARLWAISRITVPLSFCSKVSLESKAQN